MEKEITLPNPTALPSNQQITYPLDPVSQNILREFVRGVQVEAFPVGSIFASTLSTNPATTLGYGTWAAFGAGKVLVGYLNGDSDFGTGGATGGAKTHTLSTAEMPAHTHGNVIDTSGGSLNVAGGGGFQVGSTGSTGGGGSHNNLQPFIVMYYWTRTA